MLLLIAGHQNSTSLIGNGAAMLLGLPEVRAELARDPSRWPAAIEELMRLVSPNQFIRRQAREDIDVGDQTIRAADALLLILAAANRDPEAFPEPDQFVFDRPNRQNVLGHGIHYCLGAPLARLEGHIALQQSSNGGRLFVKPGISYTPTISTSGYCTLCRSPHPERQKSDFAGRRRSLVVLQLRRRRTR